MGTKMNDGQRLAIWYFTMAAVLMLAGWAISTWHFFSFSSDAGPLSLGSIHIESIEALEARVGLFSVVGLVYWFLEEVAHGKLRGSRSGLWAAKAMMGTGAAVALYTAVAINFRDALNYTGWALPELKDLLWVDAVALLAATVFFYNVLATLYYGKRSAQSIMLGLSVFSAMAACVAIIGNNIFWPSYASLAKGSTGLWWPRIWEGDYSWLYVAGIAMAATLALTMLNRISALPNTRHGLSQWFYVTLALLVGILLGELCGWIDLLGFSILSLVIMVPVGMLFHILFGVTRHLIKKAQPISC